MDYRGEVVKEVVIEELEKRAESTAQKHTYPPLGNLLGMQMETY